MELEITYIQSNNVAGFMLSADYLISHNFNFFTLLHRHNSCILTMLSDTLSLLQDDMFQLC